MVKDVEEMNTGTKFHWTKVDADGSLFSARSNRHGCSATLLGHFIWVIGAGGSNSFSLLDLKKKAWAIHSVENDRFRFHLHSASLFQDQILLLWARRSREYNFFPEPFREVLVFDPVLSELRIKPTFGDLRPKYTDSHTIDICAKMQVLVLFGGSDNEGWLFDQLHLLDLTSWKWRRPRVQGKAPSNRRKHGSCVVGSWFFVYGGDPYSAASPDLFAVKINYQGPLLWHRITVSGDEKVDRAGAGLKYVGNGRMVVFGGYFRSRNTDELFVIENINTRHPTRHSVLPSTVHTYSYEGTKPSPRQGARLLLSGDKLIVLGGHEDDDRSYFELSAK